MPLPDERPRASVANLIGRFEQTQKRQSLTFTGGSARSSSVLSQNTGDSAKEETKERREWPPKPKDDEVKPPPTIPSGPPSSWRSSNAFNQPEVKKDPPEPASVPTPPVPAKPVDPPAEKKPAVPEVKDVPVPVPVPKITAAATPKAPASSSHVTPSKHQPRTPSRSRPSHPPSAMPLKPHHTGTPSGRKSATPGSRPKTPSRTVNNSASTPSRPKTPSKKGTFSPEVADRLAKPTAASASKARDADDSPAKAPVKSAAQKAREAAAASHAAKKGLNQTAVVRKPLASTLKKKPTAATPATPTNVSGKDEEKNADAKPADEKQRQNGTSHAPVVQGGHSLSYSDEAGSEIHEEPEQLRIEDVSVTPGHVEEVIHPISSQPARSPTPMLDDTHPPLDEAVTLQEPIGKSTGDDIADMVSMLEGTASKPGADDEIPIPVDARDVLEIPDEDA